MANYNEVFEDTQELYNKAITAALLNTYMTIKVLTNDRAKDIYKVNKANELLKYRTGDDIIIVINEKVFEVLTDDQQKIVVEESIASISYDQEKEKIVITKPDVSTWSGILSKYGYDTWNTLRESIKSIYQEEKDEAERTKATAG